MTQHRRLRIKTVVLLALLFIRTCHGRSSRIVRQSLRHFTRHVCHHNPQSVCGC
ncbi:hypothetical protein COCMIDRAFT_90428 [Bipolaris oryzae ATCC 44560]|uniref:Uncharacterized protein n=1 Tax=Bipolaris oryzae ATCC 44560 TaxID=930090 RepID=W6ZC06_COCMI|nr:uncharacterized protein COCMIDRAFT_90428 [Bipolaris oryzae ATCC 44560]EUC47333.1 hypothetical protein COCMIDRAFT_90428 [Bipolaris oryzae ATCC 44560]